MFKLDHEHNLVEVRGVSFAYEQGPVLRDVSLDIHAGDYLGLVGPNGAGKTTLLKLILGLLEPTKGAIKIFGEEASRFRERFRLGYVPQRVLNFDTAFPVTVEEVVLMGRYAERGLGRSLTRNDYGVAQAALATVGLAEIGSRLVGTLSGGQTQRVFLARALVNEPEIVFFDEPTTGMDEASEEHFYDLLRKLNQERGLTVVLVSHDLERLKREAMHLACVNQTLVYFGSAQGYLHDHHHA